MCRRVSRRAVGDPGRATRGPTRAYEATAKKLAGLFQDNFKKYETRRQRENQSRRRALTARTFVRGLIADNVRSKSLERTSPGSHGTSVSTCRRPWGIARSRSHCQMGGPPRPGAGASYQRRSQCGPRRVIDELCLDRIGLDEATRSLEAVERLTPRHARWVVAVLFGLAASAIAWLLRADSGAIAVSGVASAVGLIARQELAKRPVILFAHPFAAGLIGAALAAWPSVGLDRDAGPVPDRSGADARAGPASHQQRARHAGQPHADGSVPAGARDQHPRRHRARRGARRRLTLGLATLSTAPSGAIGSPCCSTGAGRSRRLRLRCVLQRAVARAVGVDRMRRGWPRSPL